ncbi:MAG TPA: lipocalin-like domain-containing protein [Candidatus Acidoferrales bacterium]|jgi:predicted secreted hydrolase|nr:lipocalin-like domain-containing protein [Candidatus Acidoferrales bacterium]
MLKINPIIFALLFIALVSVKADDTARTADGFALPEPGHVFSFPRDYGSHDDFKIEWWYITGHLFGDDGRRFGFQATFFRSAGSLPGQSGANDPGFGHEKLFLAHMALLDVKSGTFIHQQRLNRDGWDAFSATNELNVRNGNWSLRMTDTNHQTMDLRGSFGNGASLRLELHPRKPLVVFGQNSVSRKAAEPSAASYYLTFPRLHAAGEVHLDTETNRVQGEAWMDHEISSSQLGTGQAGWDWCCLQFKDGREIMAYRMRRKDGSQDPFSTLAWVATNDVVTHLPSAEFKLETVRTWKSPHTGAVYPVSIKLQTRDPQTGQSITFLLEPLADDQELAGNGSPIYWEGACRIRDDAGKELGSAFLELTGYAGNLQKSLR